MNEAQLVLVATLASTQALGTLAVSALIYSCKHAGQQCKYDPREKVGYRFTFNNTSLYLPFRQSKPLSTRQQVVDALTIETSGMIQVDLHEWLCESRKGCIGSG